MENDVDVLIPIVEESVIVSDTRKKGDDGECLEFGKHGEVETFVVAVVTEMCLIMRESESEPGS